MEFFFIEIGDGFCVWGEGGFLGDRCWVREFESLVGFYRWSSRTGSYIYKFRVEGGIRVGGICRMRIWVVESVFLGVSFGVYFLEVGSRRSCRVWYFGS